MNNNMLFYNSEKRKIAINLDKVKFMSEYYDKKTNVYFDDNTDICIDTPISTFFPEAFLTEESIMALHWEKRDWTYCCPKCQEFAPYNQDGEQILSDYCPNCGIRLYK